MKKIIVLFILAISMYSCVDEYWPDVFPKYENALVVDGEITNKPGPYTITLSLSSDINNPSFRPFVGCEVVISEEHGESEILEEIEEGVYSTSIDGIQGKCGKSYNLSIITPKGEHYETEFDKMSFPTEIDSIYTEIEYQPHPDYDFRNITGLRFYVDNFTSELKDNYYLWKLEPTYKFNANYRIKYYWDGQMHRFANSDSLYTCYLTKTVPDIFIFNTVDLESPKISKFPLHYVTTETKELSIRYSLLVKQYSLTKDAYQYWENIKSLDNEQGTLHSRLPFQIQGNVKNVEDTNEHALGFFTVAGISEKRMFIDRPLGVDWHYPDSCNLYPIYQELLYQNMQFWPLYFPAFYLGGGQSAAWVDYQWCVDCTKLNGDLKKPEFWVD